jgi:predicted acetyltransferase
MNIEFRRLSPGDGMDIYDMLQEIPKDENGFMNGCNGKDYGAYQRWLTKSAAVANGQGLEAWMVPQSVYWLLIDGMPAGMGKLRHKLTDKLREEGGHGGYAVRPSCRGKGFGTLLLRLLLEEAKELRIDRLLLTVQNHNTPSLRVALANGGVIERVDDKRHFIWIDL